MMASMLLVFVLAVVYSVYQYYHILEQKTRELEVQQIALSRAQDDLDEQKKENEAFKIQLLSQQEELDEKNLILIIQQGDLEKAQEDLKSAQQELINAQIILANREAEVNNLQLALSAQQQQIETLVGVRPRIISELSRALAANNIEAAVDPKTGDIELKSQVFFEVNSFTIKQSGQELLNRFLPVYLGVLMQDEYKDYVAEIIIEGHTDSTGTYLSNLKLSQNRALAVAEYCLQMNTLSAQMKQKLQDILTATGKSYSDPVLVNGVEDKEASRRVEFKFRLMDTQMLEQMNEILSAGGTAGAV